MEGNHPKTTNPKPAEKVVNIGSVKNGKIGIKSIIWQMPTGGHHEIWIDKALNGKWVWKTSKDFIQWGGPTGTTTKIMSNPTIEFRCDCDKAQWSNYSVVEIVPGVRA